jgi:hypothetical protein
VNTALPVLTSAGRHLAAAALRSAAGDAAGGLATLRALLCGELAERSTAPTDARARAADACVDACAALASDGCADAVALLMDTLRWLLELAPAAARRVLDRQRAFLPPTATLALLRPRGGEPLLQFLEYLVFEAASGSDAQQPPPSPGLDGDGMPGQGRTLSPPPAAACELHTELGVALCYAVAAERQQRRAPRQRAEAAVASDAAAAALPSPAAETAAYGDTAVGSESDGEEEHMPPPPQPSAEVAEAQAEAEAEETSPARARLRAFLTRSRRHDAARVGAALAAAGEPPLSAEQVLLHASAGEHAAALRVLVERLRDCAAAEAYCASLGEGPDARAAHLELLRLYLAPPTGLPGGAQPGAESADAAAARYDRAARLLLGACGEGVDGTQVLDALPEAAPLAAALRPLSSLLRSAHHKRHTAAMLAGLARRRHQVAAEALAAERAPGVVLDSDAQCGACHSRLARNEFRPFSRFPGGLLACQRCSGALGDARAAGTALDSM